MNRQQKWLAVLAVVVVFGGAPVRSIADIEVTYVGAEVSSTSSGSVGWGTSWNVGNKKDQLSTDSDPKLFTLPGKPNAYGLDGHVFPRSNNLSQEPSGTTYQGALYTGTRSGNTFSNTTTYIASIVTLGTSGTGAGQWQLGDPTSDNIDNPIAGVGTSVADVGVGHWWRYNAASSPTPHLRITFGDGITNVLHVRVGVLTSRGDSRKPTLIMLGGAEIGMLGANAYTHPDWYFFDVTNAVPGDALDLSVHNTNWTQSAILGIVFDSETVPNDPPVITAVGATPLPAPFTAAQTATTTVSVTATDPDDDPLTYAWIKASGPGRVTFGNSAAASTDVSFAAVGTYTLRAGVSDGIAPAVYSNLTVNVVAQPGVTYATYAGAEVSSGSAGWGTSWNVGTKKDFRSTDSATKVFTLPDKPNAYGTDGYIVWSSTNANNTYSDRYTGTRSGNVYSNTTPWLESVTIVSAGGYGNVVGGYELLNYGSTVDDPNLGIGPGVADMSIGTLWLRNDGVSYATPHVRLRFSAKAARYAPIRIGVLTDRGDNSKPTAIAFGGAEAVRVAVGGYSCPDWYFFDVFEATPGAELLLAFRAGSGGSTERCVTHALVFDAVELPPAGTVILIR